MSAIQYEIVFYGTLVAGFSKQQTQEHVAQLFKTTVDQVERMFTGSRVVIRNKLDSQTAVKYIAAMKKRGAECQVEAMGEPGVKVDLSQNQEHLPISEASRESPESNKPAVPKEPVAQSTPAPVNKSGLALAGDKVDEILASAHLELAPVGERLSGENSVDESITLPDLSALTLAPTGSDLTDKKEEISVSVPDISHIKVSPLPD